MGALGYPYGYGGYFHPYGSLTLSASPISYVEPLSLTEIKEYLNLPQRSPADSLEDNMLNGYISAAREIAEVEQGRDLVRKQWDLSFDYLGSYYIELRDPLVSVDMFRYRDSGGNYTTLVEGTDFDKNTTKHPGVVTPMFNTFWPVFIGWPSSAVLIRFTSGFAPSDQFWLDAGKRIKVGMMMLISGWFNNRLPYAIARAIIEYPYGVAPLLQTGSVRRVR